MTFEKRYDLYALLFILVAFATDLLTPWQISSGRIPPSLRWISQGVVALLLFWALLRMIAQNKFPAAFWLIIFFSIIEFINAEFRGQGITITAWGWWLTFQFPLVAIFTYLQRGWPDNFPRYIIIGFIIIMGAEVLLQIYQYLRGTTVGDQLSGTFGKNGTGNLVLFLLLVTCFAFGEWIIRQKWLPLIFALVFGAASSSLGEMKIFLPATVLLGIISMLLYTWRTGKIWKIIPYLLILAIIAVGFIAIYDWVVPSAQNYPLERYFSDPQLVGQYLGTANQYVAQQSYYTDIGRNFAVQYGWDQINIDPLALLFGFGLGSRSESSSLGLVGQELSQGGLGVSTGSSLLIMMQELGLIGLTILAIFMVVVIVTLFRQVQQQPSSQANGLRYGLILFTIFWPLWLWYNTAWLSRVPNLLYWSVLGYCLRGFEPGENVVSVRTNP